MKDIMKTSWESPNKETSRSYVKKKILSACLLYVWVTFLPPPLEKWQIQYVLDLNNWGV